jgi:hypothetical protein
MLNIIHKKFNNRVYKIVFVSSQQNTTVDIRISCKVDEKLLNDLLENMITTIENKRIEMINNNSI